MKKAVIVYGPHSPFTKELLNACLKVKVKLLRHVQPFATSWTVAFQAPLSMGFSRQGFWSGLPFPSPGDLPDPGIEPGSALLRQALYRLSQGWRCLLVTSVCFT